MLRRRSEAEGGGGARVWQGDGREAVRADDAGMDQSLHRLLLLLVGNVGLVRMPALRDPTRRPPEPIAPGLHCQEFNAQGYKRLVSIIEQDSIPFFSVFTPALGCSDSQNG